MTIHAFPIPSLKLLLKTFFSKSTVVFDKRMGEENEYLFSRGTWALAAAIEYVMAKRHANKIKVWLPDYFCADALAAFDGKNVTCFFYPINKELSPDWNVLEQNAKAEPPDVFVLVHYFGFINAVERADRFCHQHKCELIEDACHVAQLTNHPHLTIYSPRKIYAVPEGGRLISREVIDPAIVTTGQTTGLRIIWRWIIRRLIQKILVRLGIDWHSLAGFAVRRRVEKAINSANGSRYANVYTKKMLIHQADKIERVVNQRRENYQRMAQSLVNKKTVKPLFAQLSGDVCPYVLPLLVYFDKAKLEKKMHSLGIPASSWPTLPLAVRENRVEHANAVWLNERILLLPVHQSLTPQQVDYMIQCLKQYVM